MAVDIKKDALNMLLSIDNEESIVAIRNYIARFFKKLKNSPRHTSPATQTNDNHSVDFSFVDDIFGKLNDQEAEEMREHCHLDFKEMEV